jgi:hypothetical protein
MKRYYEMDVDEYMDTMEDLAWQEAQGQEEEAVQKPDIDKLLKEHRIRNIKAVMIVGDAAYAYRPPYGAEERLTKLAQTLGVTEQDLVDWFMEN